MRGQTKVLSAFAVLSAFLVLGVALASATAPTVSVDNATTVSYTSAHVAGEVDPQGQSTTYRFEYTPQAQFEAEGFENSTTGPQATIEGAAQAVEGELSGLTPSTTYHLRLVAENGDGPSEATASSSFTTLTVAGPTVSISTPIAVTDSSAHFAGEINPGGTDPAFDVNWRFQCSPECPGLTGGTISADNSSHEVTADATGLNPGTAYEVMLIVSNAGGQASAGPESFSTATTAPQVKGTSASALKTEATLEAQLNPGGLETTYFFEYGATSGYGQVTNTKTIPAGGVPVAVKAGAFGLTPASSYHFKLIASNAIGSTESSDRSFTTQSNVAPAENCPNEAIRIQQHAQRLFACRAFEQVSPVDKNSASAGNILQFGANGEGIAWTSLGAHSGTKGSNAISPYASLRSASGWTTTPFSPTYNADVRPDVFTGLEGWAFPEDLSSLTFSSQGRFAAEDEDNYPGGLGFGPKDVFRSDSAGRVTFLSHGEGMAVNGFGSAALAGMSGDGTSVFFENPEPMTPTVPPGSEQLYRWRAGQVEAVGVDPNGQFLSGGSWLGQNATAVLAGAGPAGQLPDSSAVSKDGSRFVYGGRSAASPFTQVYLHQDGAAPRELSLSQRDATKGEPSAADAIFLQANRAFTKVYFLSKDQLTNAAPVDGGLYVYDLETNVLAFVVVDDSQATNSFNFGAAGITRISDDGSYVYFVSPRDLAAGAVTGSRNLYVQHNGAISFIATLSNNDPAVASSPKPDAQAFNPSLTRSGISADGSKLVFESSASLAGADLGGHSGVYLYDATTQALACVSCRADGGPSQADSTLELKENELTLPTPNAISADGRSVVFTSGDQLLPGDTNNQDDVYEYRDGRLALVSEGTSRVSSIFVGMSSDGANLYFKTSQSLVTTDTDGGLTDIYDARVGGGFYVDAPGPGCEGVQCQGAPAAAPAPTSAGTAGIAGAGNLKQRHAKKKKRAAKRAHKHRNQHKRAGHGRGGSR